MTVFDFCLAIGQLVDEGLVLPYDKMPGATLTGKMSRGFGTWPDGEVPAKVAEDAWLRTGVLTAFDWDRYRYNPPAFLGETAMDHRADLKPGWEGITEALGRYHVARLEPLRARHRVIARQSHAQLRAEGAAIGGPLDAALTRVEAWIDTAKTADLEAIDPGDYMDVARFLDWPRGGVV